MLDEQEFGRAVESDLTKLKQHLIARLEGEDPGFDIEEQSGAVNVLFEQLGDKFVVTPNTPVRQIWISALATSFKLDWDATVNGFVLPRTGEALISLVDRLIREHLED